MGSFAQSLSIWAKSNISFYFWQEPHYIQHSMLDFQPMFIDLSPIVWPFELEKSLGYNWSQSFPMISSSVTTLETSWPMLIILSDKERWSIWLHIISLWSVNCSQFCPPPQDGTGCTWFCQLCVEECSPSSKSFKEDNEEDDVLLVGNMCASPRVPGSSASSMTIPSLSDFLLLSDLLSFNFLGFTISLSHGFFL